MSAKRFVGIDAGRNDIEVAIRPTDDYWKTSFGEDAFADIGAKLSLIEPELVVLEASGTFELPVAGALATADLPFAMVHPRHIREFARALGQGRPDRPQAGLLARFAELVHPTPYAVSAEVTEFLRDLKARRHELMEILADEKRRLQSASAAISREIQNHIWWIERSLKLNTEHCSRAIRYGRALSVV